MSTPDFGRTAADYATHRAGFPPSLFARLQHLGLGVAGQAVVDVGSGTGSLARGFAARGCRVVAVDIAAPLLDEALRLAAEQGVPLEVRVARAEETGLPAGTADVVTAGQCWHWFDRPAAAREVRRLLRPGGALVIAHFDWLPLAGNVVEATEALIREHNPAWAMGGGTGLYPQWLRDLGEGGLRELQSFSYDEAVNYTPEAWRGRIRASAGVGASLGPDAVEAFDRALAESLARSYPETVLSVPHRVFAVLARR